MLVSYDWLKEYVDIDLAPADLAERLTLSGSEVEGLSSLGAKLHDQIVVGQIIQLEPHPDGRLQIAKVAIDRGPLTVVTGAPNVAVGQKVPLALVGSVLPGGQTIMAVDFGDVTSTGMLLSEKELELGDDTSGIMVLPEDTPLGIPLAEALGLDDIVIELEIYPNRPDCMSVIGIAREVAAITGRPLRLPAIEVSETDEPIDGATSVTVEDEELCPFYSARVVRNIKVGPSPLWLQRRVMAGGMRPINNVVDITNFVLLEMGQPLHAFDYNKLEENRIVVRRARPGEIITTLDGEKRTLDSETLVIADAHSPVCIAGIMGGADSQVHEGTTDILLEAAIFQRVSIRRTSRRLGLRSEASARFERGLDPDGVMRALDRAAQLLAEIAGGEILKGIAVATSQSQGANVVTLDPERCNRLLGADIPVDDMVRILEGLEFGVTNKDGRLEVEVPSHRLDIELEADLVEEVARMYGYHRIPATLPKGVTQREENERLQIVNEIRNLLIGAGLTEIMTLSFDSPTSFDKLQLPPEHRLRQAVAIQNPLTEDMGTLRTSLLPHLLDVVRHNTQRQQTNLQVFELGSVYIPSKLPIEDQPREQQTLGLAMTGLYPRQWGLPPREVDFFDLKGLLELVFQRLGIACQWERAIHPGFHPGRCAVIKLADTKIGVLGEIHREVAENWELTARVYVAEIDLEAVIPQARREVLVEKLPRYPLVARDLALLAPDTVPAEVILRTMEDAGDEIVKDITLFDVYQGRQIPDGYRSLAYSVRYQASDRTLTDEEIQAAEDAIMTRLEEELGITRR